MQSRDEIIASIGQTICGVSTSAEPVATYRHRCKGATGAQRGAGCIQLAVGGTECFAYRQAKSVLNLLETSPDIVPAIRRPRAEGAHAGA